MADIPEITPDNADIPISGDMKDLLSMVREQSDLLEQQRLLMRRLNTMAINDPQGLTMHTRPKTISWTNDDDAEAFSPKKVDWEQLAEMYEDDPLLADLFNKMIEHYVYTLRWDASKLYGLATTSGTTTNGLSWGTNTVSTPGHAKYDPTNGTVTVTYDED